MQKKIFTDYKHLFYLFIFSLLITLLTEMMSRGFGQTLTFFSTFPIILLLNFSVCIILLAPSLLFLRVKFVSTIIALPLILLGLMNGILMHLRGTPFVLSDLSLFSEGMGILAQYVSMKNVFLFLLVLFCFGLLLYIIFKKENYSFVPKSKRCILWLGTSGISVVIVSFLTLTNAIIPTDYEKYFTYEKNGFVYEWAHNLMISFIPEGQNSLLAKDQLASNTSNSTTTDDMLQTKLPTDAFNTAHFLATPFLEESSWSRTPNIIFLQLESIIDPYTLDGVSLSANPIPHIHEAMAMGYSGILDVPTFSGGTPRTEFEILTGMNLNTITVGVPYADGTLDTTPVETVAHILHQRGYTTTSLHNHYGDFFDRYLIYSLLGFDHFLSRETMYNLSFENDWAKDDKVVEYLIDTLEKTPTKDFLFAVAVSTHGPYTDTPDPNAPFAVSGIKDASTKSQLENYLRRVNEVDLVVKQMVDYVTAMEEDTILVIYSDHGPNLKILEDYSKEKKHQTFYTIIDNQNLFPVSQNNRMEAYEIYPFIFETLGIHDGYMNRFYQNFREDTAYRANREVLQNTLLDGHPSITSTDVTVGLAPPVITKVTKKGDTLELHGENLTFNTFIFVNGEQLGVNIISPEHVIIKYNKPLEGEFYAAYVGMNNTILNTSKLYTFEAFLGTP